MAPPKVKPIGGRVVMPKGYLLGRASNGDGPPELISIDQLQGMGVAGAARANDTAQKTGFGFKIDGRMLDNEALGSGIFHRDVTFTDATPGTVINSLVPAHADAVLRLMSPDTFHIPAVVGTITFLAGTKAGILAWVGSSFTLTSGIVLSLVAPTPADTTLGFLNGIVMGRGAL